MGVDANTNTVPDAGLIYDGSEPPGTPFSTVHVTGISVAKATITTSEGRGVWLDAKTTPSNATFPDVTWSSSDESVCTVSGNSLTAVKEGTAVLTATAVDGGLTATCTVKVEKRRPSYWDDDYDEYISGSDDAKAKKKANPMVVKAKKKVLVVSRAKLKAKKLVIAKKKAFRISKAKGEVAFKVAKYDKKAKKRIYVTKAGKLVVKRGLARGIYTLKVKVRATGNAQYATKAKIVKLKVRVK
ncbi:MAG TPA: hypothetical protein DCP91_12365 [Eggerthellaceae bacterium]|nr:hypothetical protein [Eggerthellaceae bacterium]